MRIRRGNKDDIAGISRLLTQIHDVHHRARPDLFKAKGRKYTDEQLVDLLHDEAKPIFVATPDDSDDVLGYAFCVLQQNLESTILTDVRTLYIDDLCVDESARGRHVGSSLYRHILDFARESGCYNVTLNVWVGNESARIFYERMGLVPQKVGMETIL